MRSGLRRTAKFGRTSARTASKTAGSRKNSVTPIKNELTAAGSRSGRSARSCRASSAEWTFNIRRQAGSRRRRGPCRYRLASSPARSMTQATKPSAGSAVSSRVCEGPMCWQAPRRTFWQLAAAGLPAKQTWRKSNVVAIVWNASPQERQQKLPLPARTAELSVSSIREISATTLLPTVRDCV